MLEKTVESLLDCKEIQLVNPKGNQSWQFIGRTDAEAETPKLRPPDVKKRLIEKDPHAERLKAWGEGDHRGRDGWMDHRHAGHEFKQVPGVGDGQGSLACCNPWGRKELDMTE